MSKLPRPDFNKTSAPDMCADYLRGVILNGEYESGQALVLDRVARELGISHTPIREAVRKLEAEGFVEYIPRRGAIVRPTLFEDFVQLVEIRKALEPILLVGAIKNNPTTGQRQLLDEKFSTWAAKTDPTERLSAQWDFYAAMYALAGKPLILNAAKANWQHIFRYHRIAWDHREEATTHDFELMQELTSAFCAGDQKQSLQALNATIDWGLGKVREYLSS